MKKQIFILSIVALIFACKKDSASIATVASITGQWTGVYQIKLWSNPVSRDSVTLIPGSYKVNFMADGTIAGTPQTYKVNGTTLIWTTQTSIDTFQITTLTDAKLTLYKRRAANLETWDNYSR